MIKAMKRRTFLKMSTAALAATAVAGSFKNAEAKGWKEMIGKTGSQPNPGDEGAKIVRSVCLMCHGGCGIQAKVVNGELVRLTGNPYHPNTYDYIAKGDITVEADLDAGANGKDVGSLCPKGQSGIFALYSPFRLQHPMKRVGPRGSGKWKVISWNQAIKEISHGGLLFQDVPGEKDRKVEGLSQILNNDKPIGPEDSAFMDEAPPAGWGPKRNQFVWAHGRNEQTPLTPRFVLNAAGVPNMLNHCSRCAGTFYSVVEATLNLPPYEIGNYCDYEYCDYLISVGSNITQADYPMQTRTRYLQKFAKRVGPDAKKFKHVVVDPRFSNAAAKATHNGVGEWVPLKPASDAYFLLGMIQWILANNGYKKEYLTLPNEKVAKERGYRTWTDMTYLVGASKEPKTFLSGKDAGLGQSDYVVLINGKPTMFQEATGLADLDASAVVNGVEYKTVFRLLKERAQEHTLAECEAVCDIPDGTIAKIAREFTSAKHPTIEMFRGPVQQSNGWYNGQALCIINMLVDNIDRKGGYISGHAAYKGDVKTENGRKPSGIRADTAKAVYHGKKPLATRPWYSAYSVLRGVTPNFFSSVRMGYPYRIKAYLNYYNNPAYTMPYNQETVEALLDLKAMPLTVSIDAYMGETSALCDYVLPDTEYLERIGGFKTYPPVKTQVWGVRQPVVGGIDPLTHDYRPIRPDTRTGDDILIMIAKECGLPTFGKDGGGKGVDLDNSWQFWNEYYKNKDFTDGLDPNKPLSKMGGKFQNPAPKYQYEAWPSGDYTAFHGGRKVRLLMTYQEKVATYKNAMTGTYMDGLPMYRTIVDCKEQPLDPAIYKEYPFQLHTWKEVFHTQSRTMNNLWLASIKPQNYAEINPADAERLNVQTGDWVKVKSPSSEAIESDQYPNYRKNLKQYYPNYLGGGWFKFQIRVTSRIRPGLFSVSQSYGRFGAGARKWYMGGKEQANDKRVGAGFHINPLYMADPVLKNMVLVDPVGGGTQSYGTPLRVERI